ncbi:MAG: cytochrome b N-terminal domain-containing protein [Bdellovibrionaceae bacterium]|nr:cytochrome b N-terminal domain-containing protein [Pseudobdellovibrionaceae bacterium]
MRLRDLDRIFNRFYSSKYNPLYQSGSIALGLFIIVAVTGTYLSFFYRLGEPYESVEALNQSFWFGSWVRALHRYASDLMVVAVVFHVFRMIVHKKYFGPRTFAWVSGVGLLFLLLISGWTGYVMVWDVQAQALAAAGAKMFDSLGLFSDPIARSFNGIEHPPASFFFLNLFLHVVLPLGMVFGIWIHTSRMARADWFPHKKIIYGMLASLIVVSVIWPAPLGLKADLLKSPEDYPIDWFFNFWISGAESYPLLTFLLFMAGGTLLAGVPWFFKPKSQRGKSFNDPNICEGCTQCVQDCPYEAIQMMTKDVNAKMKTVAVVTPELCVSCGLCSASCDPMTIGPEGRKGGDQLKEAKQFLESLNLDKKSLDHTLIVGCSNQSAVLKNIDQYCQTQSTYHLYPAECPGTLHSMVYRMFAARFSRVVVASCPSRNCVNKDGYMLLTERMSGDREPTILNPQLRERVHAFPLGDGEEKRFFEVLENTESILESQKTSSWKTRVSALIVSLGLVFLIAGLTRIPGGAGEEEGLLRVSIRLVGQNEKSCQEPSAEEMAKLPIHMRATEVCTYRALSYQLKLSIDGKEHLNEQVHPGGLRRDRPIYVNHEIKVATGVRDVQFSMEPIDSQDESIVSLNLERKVEFNSGQVALLYYSLDTKNADIKESTATEVQSE